MQWKLNARRQMNTLEEKVISNVNEYNDLFVSTNRYIVRHDAGSETCGIMSELTRLSS